MASIKFSGFGVTEMAGKVGGSTVQRNGSGSFLKRSSNPGRARSISQTRQKAGFGNISNNWRFLTDEQRTAWNRAAASGEWVGYNRLGDARNITGFMLYMELGGNLQTIGQSPLLLPPLKTQFPAVRVTDVVISERDQLFSVTFEGSFDGYAIIISGSYSIGSGTSRYENLTLFVRGWTDDASATYSAYVDVFGAPIVGGFVFLEFEMISTVSGLRQSFDKYRAEVV